MSAAPAGLRSSGDVIVFDRVSYAIGGRTILENVSFTVSAGSTSVVMGPSGIGKSTILRLILGLIRPQSAATSSLGSTVCPPPPHHQHEIALRTAKGYE